MAKKQTDKRKTYPKDLERQITKNEAQELGPKMGACLQQIATLKERKAQATKEWQSKIDTAELELERLGEAVRTGRIEESVLVYDEPDERRLEVVTKRADNDKVVDRRAMTAAERQGSLPGTAADDAEEDPEDGDPEDDDDAEDEDGDEDDAE
jgi:hypothetical protein